MSDPHNPVISEYVKPSEAELKARSKRNFAIAACLFAFVAFVMILMLYKYGAFN